MSGHREAVATYTGEQADSRRAPGRKQTGTVSGERAPPDFSRNSGVLTGNRLRPGSSRSARGEAGGWWATYTGEREDRGPAPSRQQTEMVSGECVPPDFSRNSGVLTGSRLRPGAPGARRGRWRLAVLETQRTEKPRPWK